LKRITEERAERIAKAHPCANCDEYSFKRLSVAAASKDREDSLGVAWIATRTCGVCGAEQEIGIAPDGAIVYES